MNKAIIVHHEAEHGSTKSYAVGFASSVLLTLLAFALVSHHLLSGWSLILCLGALALVQLAVQLLFFLHLGNESRPRWNLMVLLFAAMVVVAIVFGSMWIMYNLNYNMHHKPASETDTTIIKDEGYRQSTY